MRAFVDRRVRLVAVPADAETIAVRGDPGELRVQTLVDDRVDRPIHQFLGQNRVAQVGHPSAHRYLVPRGSGPTRIHHTRRPVASSATGDPTLIGLRRRAPYGY